jgi:hypothetical protein
VNQAGNLNDGGKHHHYIQNAPHTECHVDVGISTRQAVKGW